MEYTALQLDALREVINIGGGNAATSIAKMVSRPIDMNVPEVTLLSYEELYEQIMEDDQEVHAVISNIIGEIGGVFLFVLNEETANQLTEYMIGSTEFSDEVKESAITELANILSNSFLNAIGKMLDQQLLSSLPQVHFDYFGALISSMYLALNQYDDQVLIIRNEFFYDKERLDASLFFIPEMGVIEKLLKSLGM